MKERQRLFIRNGLHWNALKAEIITRQNGRDPNLNPNQFQGAVALTVGSVLRGTILNDVICIGHYRGQRIQQPIEMR